MNYACSDVFCDALCVTYDPDDSVCDDAYSFLEASGFSLTTYTEDYALFYAGEYAMVRLETKPQYHKVEIKGKALEHFRSLGLFSECLAFLASRNHKVTRLDLALDVQRDFPNVLHGVRSRFPDGYCRVSRKRGKITELLEPRDSDGKRSGTLYIGSHGGKARKFVRVYDKQLEALQKRGEVLPPTTRYEFVIREDVTLRDAACPAPCFWHFMSIELLKAPQGVEPWVKGSVFGWQRKTAEKLPVELLLGYLDRSPQLARMVQLADLCGDKGRSFLLSQLTKRISSDRTLGVTPP